MLDGDFSWDPLFWGTWAALAALCWFMLQVPLARRRKKWDERAAAAKAASDASRRRHLAQDNLVTYTSQDVQFLALEAEICRSTQTSLVSQPQDFGWILDDAPRLGLRDIPAIDAALRECGQRVVRLASKFRWHSFRRGDAIWLLFQVLAAKRGSEAYIDFSNTSKRQVALPEDVLKALAFIDEEDARQASWMWWRRDEEAQEPLLPTRRVQ
jgi:hypothetical protein